MLKQCVETMGVVRESKGKLGSKKLSSAHDTVSKKHASAVKKGPAKPVSYTHLTLPTKRIV